jgi:hypothetical protein
MANRDAPAGFRVVRHATGGDPNRLNTHLIASGLASNIGKGDPVIPVNTSKNINIATAGARLIGVFFGVVYFNSDGVQYKPNWATGTTLTTGTVAEAAVADDPALLFGIQGDEDIVAADIGALADVLIGAPNALGNSTTELDSSTVGSGDQLRIEELLKEDDNAYGDFAKIVVQISDHYKAAALTAI